MSNASVIKDVSEVLRSILETHFKDVLPDQTVTVTVDSPQRVTSPNLNVNLYLYHILQDESRRNTGPLLQPASAPNAVSLVPEPLPLKLYYLVTAFAPNGPTEHRLIGEVIQVFYSHGILEPEDLQNVGLGQSSIRADRIRIVMLNQDLESLHRIWGNFQEALRASATFEVEGIYLDALAEPTVIYKQPRELDFKPLPSLSEVVPAAARPGDTIRLHGSNLDLRSPVNNNVSLVRILFNGTAVPPLSEQRTNRALSIKVPDLPPGVEPGPVPIQVQIGDHISRAVIFEVLK
jgi:hypothetical protein